MVGSDVSEAPLDLQDDAGTSQRQTYTTGEFGCSVPGPTQGMSLCLQKGDGEKVWAFIYF